MQWFPIVEDLAILKEKIRLHFPSEIKTTFWKAIVVQPNFDQESRLLEGKDTLMRFIEVKQKPAVAIAQQCGYYSQSDDENDSTWTPHNLKRDLSLLG